MLPRRLVQPHGESTGRIIFPLTAPRPSPSMNQPNFSQNCGSTHRRDAVRRFMKLPVASRAPGAVPDYRNPSKELFQEETRCLFVRSLHVTLKRFFFLLFILQMCLNDNDYVTTTNEQNGQTAR